MSSLRDDPRLTAYALGELELEADELARFEAELAADADAQAELAEIQQVSALLARELAGSSGLALGATHSARIEQEDVAWAPPPELSRRRTPYRVRILTALAAAAVVAAGVLIMLWRPQEETIVDSGGYVTFAPAAAPAPEPEAGESSLPRVRRFSAKARRPTLLPPTTVRDEALRESDKSFVDPLTTPHAAPSAERYDEHEDNPFVPVANDPRSTFSIDVDTASFALMRRFLDAGELPPAGAIRIEELVNYFRYAYPEPRGDEPFALSALLTEAPWAPEHRLLRIGLKAREIDRTRRPASNLVFLIDVSGSMADQNKLPLLKDGLRMLVGELDARDHVAIVVYAGSSGLVLPPTRGDRKVAILDALDRLEAGGSTNGGEGIELAYAIAARQFVSGGTNRVLLATDGDFNVGVTDRDTLVELIQRRAKTGVYLSVLGFGQGNYQDALLEQLADKGNGNYAYLDGLDEARKVLVEQASGTLVTVAKDVKLQLEFNPGEVRAYRLIGYENRVLEHTDFNDDGKDAGEIGAGHTVTAFYELVTASGELPGGLVDPLKYRQPPAPAPGQAAHRGELVTLKLRYQPPAGGNSRLQELVVRDEPLRFRDAPEDLRFGAAVAAFGMLLRDSPHRGNASFEQVLQLAERARGDGRDREAREQFIELVREAARLARDPR